MENNKIENVPYIVHESITVKLDRTIKRLWIMCLILIALLVTTNLVWVWYEGQFETVITTTQEVEQSNDNGNNTFVGGDYNGNSKN